ncbi:OmpA family protein [bacterium]|nr:OmpA family protein [bacterium]
MAFKKKHKPEDENWLVTYADMVTLLMSFFILMATVSKPQPSLFEGVKQGLISEFATEGKGKGQEAATTETAKDAIQALLLKHKASKEITMEDSGNGMMMDFTEASLFEPNSATISDKAKPILDDLVLELARVEYDKYRIVVEGHTDDTQPTNPAFPTNWELSSVRAAAVVRYFIAKGFDPRRLTASGYADTFPKRPNKDGYGNPIEENRAINRRISIMLERD